MPARCTAPATPHMPPATRPDERMQRLQVPMRDVTYSAILAIPTLQSVCLAVGRGAADPGAATPGALAARFAACRLAPAAADSHEPGATAVAVGADCIAIRGHCTRREYDRSGSQQRSRDHTQKAEEQDLFHSRTSHSVAICPPARRAAGSAADRSAGRCSHGSARRRFPAPSKPLPRKRPWCC